MLYLFVLTAQSQPLNHFGTLVLWHFHPNVHLEILLSSLEILRNIGWLSTMKYE